MDKIWANSGDSHWIEEPDFWEQHLPPKLAERMPRSVKSDDGLFETVHVDGQSFERRLPTVYRNKNKDGLSMVEESSARAPGAGTPTLRLADLDQEGIWGEMIFASIGLWQFMIRDPELAREGVRVQNDWTAAEIAAVSERLVPTAGVSLLDVDDAVAELQRCAGMGFRAVCLPIDPPDGHDQFNRDSWEPLWAAAEEAEVAIAFHIGTSDAKDIAPHRGPGAMVQNYVEQSYGGQRAAMRMVSSGALDRHPGLKLIVAEGGASWVPVVGDRMNEAYRQHHGWVKPKLSRLPKEILFDQVYTSFMHDVSAVATLSAMGYNNVMWGSDYPHVEGTFGHTQETLHELFDGVPDAVRHRITVGTFLDLFPEVGEPPASQAA
jgi:predicted TIM-barrel fold metal-dependent hydrolase